MSSSLKLVLLGFSLLATGPLGADSLACSCAGGGASPREALSFYDAVFFGRITSINLVGAGLPTRSEQLIFDGELEVTIQVLRAWKGASGPTTTVRTEAQTTACGYPFQVGEYYLVYAKQRSSSKTLETGLCSHTKERQKAFADFAELGAPSYEPK